MSSKENGRDFHDAFEFGSIIFADSTKIPPVVDNIINGADVVLLRR